MNGQEADWQLVERVAPECREWFAKQAEAAGFPTRAQLSQEDVADEAQLAKMRRDYIDRFRKEHAGEVEESLDREFIKGLSDLNHNAPLVKEEIAHREIEPFLWRHISEDETVWSKSRTRQKFGQFFFTLIGIEFDVAKASKLGIRLLPESGVANGFHAGAERKCEIALREILPQAAPDLSKRDFKAKMKNQIAGLSDRGFDRVWGKVAPEYGRDRPGRRPSPKNRNT